jgi:hypothetical protein
MQKAVETVVHLVQQTNQMDNKLAKPQRSGVGSYQERSVS